MRPKSQPRLWNSFWEMFKNILLRNAVPNIDGTILQLEIILWYLECTYNYANLQEHFYPGMLKLKIHFEHTDDKNEFYLLTSTHFPLPSYNCVWFQSFWPIIFLSACQKNTFFSFCNTTVWTRSLHLEPLHKPFLWWVFFPDRVSLFPLGWLGTTILLIFASWVARITVVSHWHLAEKHIFNRNKWWFHRNANMIRLVSHLKPFCSFIIALPLNSSYLKVCYKNLPFSFYLVLLFMWLLDFSYPVFLFFLGCQCPF
jgi:hypothetical protein